MQLDVASGFWLFLYGRQWLRDAKCLRELQWHDDDRGIHGTDLWSMFNPDNRRCLQYGCGLSVAHAGLWNAGIARSGVFSHCGLCNGLGLHDCGTNVPRDVVQSLLQQGLRCVWWNGKGVFDAGAVIAR